MILFAEAETSTGQWAAVGGLLTIVFAQLGKWIADYRHDKSSSELRRAELESTRAAEGAKLAALQEIARSNNDIRGGQIEQNGKLSAAVQVNKAYHDELIRVIGTTCKAQPVVVQQVNQTEKEQIKQK